MKFNNETFRDDFTFKNSPQAIKRFPFPFDKDEYMYSVNLEPVTSRGEGTPFEFQVDVDEHYVSEIKDRALVLEEDPKRCQSLPHMTLAGWDLLEWIMDNKAKDYPELFSLHKEGKNWTWINKPLEIEQSFTFLNEDTLPYGPMEYITRQTQGDFALLSQRENNLWMDAGMITSQADWSLDFDIGMNFNEIHAPVPRAPDLGIINKALKFLLNIQIGSPARRLNWTMTVNPMLDTSPEKYHEWGVMRGEVTPENMGEKMYLRVELQSLVRMPRSNAIAFPIRCYLCKFSDIMAVPKWARRLHRVISTLPDDLAEYKGFIGNKQIMIDYLSKFDDGKETSEGIYPSASGM